MEIYFGVVTVIMGLVMGSFLNCLAGRLLTNESIISGRSHCEYCGHLLNGLDLVPVFSYLFLKGKCRYCHHKISIEYPVFELVTAIVYLIIYLRFFISLDTLMWITLFSILLVICYTDLKEFLIFDQLIIAGIITRVIFILLQDNILQNLLNSFLAGICFSLPLFLIVTIMEKIKKKELMGGGDIKLLFMLGLYFSVSETLLTIMLACVIGIIFGLIYNHKKIDQAFPFGPCIVLASFITLLFGNQVISWYTSLFI